MLNEENKEQQEAEETSTNEEKTFDLNTNQNEEVPEENISMKASYKKKLAKKDEEIEKLKQEVEKWKNDYYRAYADMANLRKDIQKDHSEAVKYRIEGFVHDLLMVLDSFELALKNEPQNEETKNYLKGFQYVYSTLLGILNNEGVKAIDPALNEKFDPKTMQAIDKIESDDEENLVKEQVLKGYKLYDHLIRPAMVKVSCHKTEKEVEEKEENSQEESK